ncbi:hypothetical protein HaLaN_07036, partial [Haematococcus lacustris]
MPPKRKRKRPVSPAQSAAGASGSGQQDQEQGQAVKVVIAERRQVIKAALRGLVEAAQPDLSPTQVDAVVAEVNKLLPRSAHSRLPSSRSSPRSPSPT